MGNGMWYIILEQWNGVYKIEVPTRVGTCWHWGPYLETSGSFILIRLSGKSIGVYVIMYKPAASGKYLNERLAGSNL